MSISLEGTKNLLVCPRCNEEKEDQDCIYNVYVEVKGVEGSSHEGSVLEDFDYRVCGTCQDEIQRCISGKYSTSKKKDSGRPRKTPEPRTGQQVSQSSQGFKQNDYNRPIQ